MARAAKTSCTTISSSSARQLTRPKIKGMTTAVDAFKKIAEAGAAGNAIFISRGDKSGTNTKELAIWKSAEITPEGEWYVSAGQGMGEVLTMADEQQAYTLSDRATYLARTKTGLKLKVLVEKDKSLLNPYGVIAVNPDKGPQINTDLADQVHRLDHLRPGPAEDKRVRQSGFRPIPVCPQFQTLERSVNGIAGFARLKLLNVVCHRKAVAHHV